MDGDEQEKKLVLGKDPVDYVCFGEHTGLTYHPELSAS
jgi:hypothetical protein